MAASLFEESHTTVELQEGSADLAARPKEPALHPAFDPLLAVVAEQ